MNNSEYILINLYNDDSKNDAIDVLSSLFELLEEFDISPTKQLVMAGAFNVFITPKLEAHGRNPTLKKSLAKFIEFKETYDLCDIRKYI